MDEGGRALMEPESVVRKALEERLIALLTIHPEFILKVQRFHKKYFRLLEWLARMSLKGFFGDLNATLMLCEGVFGKSLSKGNSYSYIL